VFGLLARFKCPLAIMPSADQVPVNCAHSTMQWRRRDRIERREVETTGRGGCDSQTVRKEGPEDRKLLRKSDATDQLAETTPADLFDGRFRDRHHRGAWR
jgi:hypothetical protein